MQATAHDINEDEFLNALSQEGKQVPEEHRERLLQIVHLFRERDLEKGIKGVRFVETLPLSRYVLMKYRGQIDTPPYESL